MILIWGHPDDIHVTAVVNQLSKLNAEYVIFNTCQYPFGISIDSTFTETYNETFLLVGNDKIDINDITSVWNRRTPPIVIPRKIPQAYHRFIRSEAGALFESLEGLMLDRFWLSKPSAIDTAALKLYQLSIAQKLGLLTPPTYIGNNESSALTFANRYESLINKGIHRSWSYVKLPLWKSIIKLFNHKTEEDIPFGWDIATAYTKKLSQHYITDRIKQLTLCPTTLQAYIEKELELRITIVGKKIFACAIESQNSERAKTDWRFAQYEDLKHYEYNLPSEIKTKLLLLTEKLDLKFGCVDMIVTPNNEYIFLEINPNGQWYWIEEMTGMPIASEIAKLLVNQTN